MSLVEPRDRMLHGAISAPARTEAVATVPATGWRAFIELTKPRLNSLVLVAAAVGYAMASATSSGGIDNPALLLAHVLFGTALCAGGGAALNQWIERDQDALMRRTQNRPMPSGRVSESAALRFGAVISAVGVVYLSIFTHPIAALVAFLTVVIYALVYTPMKRVSSINTLIGAIPGAMPPLIGWAAARGSLDAGAWALFLIVYVWQMPHFLAIAWVYRDDYRRGGFPMLPVIDDGGHRTTAAIMSWSAMLLPTSLAPVILGQCGLLYALVALTLGFVQIGFAMSMLVRRTNESARALFFYSIIYLPVLLAALVIDATLLPRLLSQ